MHGAAAVSLSSALQEACNHRPTSPGTQKLRHGYRYPAHSHTDAAGHIVIRDFSTFQAQVGVHDQGWLDIYRQYISVIYIVYFRSKI